MQFSTHINNVKAIEWGLTITEAYLFSFLYEVPSWCDDHYRGGKNWKWIARDKIMSELPLINLSSRSVYRVMKSIESKGLIVLSSDKTACKTLMRLTDKGKEWRLSDDTIVKSDNGHGPMSNLEGTIVKDDIAPMSNMTMPIDKSDDESVNHLSVNQESYNQDQNTYVPSDDDTDVRQNEKSISSEYSEAFEQAWSLYPKREGANNKRAAYKQWNARIKAGVDEQMMIAGTKAYSMLTKAEGSYGTKYVKLGSTFYGADEHFRELAEKSAKGLDNTGTVNRGLDDKDYEGNWGF